MSGRELVRALQGMLPGAQFAITGCHDWHSVTFAGQRISIAGQLADWNGKECLHEFAASLPEREFALPGHIVAEIAMQMGGEGAAAAFVIEALILED